MSLLPRRTALALAALAAAACGGSDGPSGPAAPSGSQVATQLSQLSTRLSSSSPAAAYIGIASTGLALGVQPSAVNLTVSAAARGAAVPGLSLATASSAAAAAKFSAVGFRLVGRNVPGYVGDLVINGGVMWDDALSEVVVVLGTGGASSFDPDASGDDFAMGAIHRVSPEASWLATSGSMNVGAPSTGGACPGTAMAGFTCALGSFSLGYDIGASMAVPYQGNGATGSRTASLATATVNGFVMTVDYERLGASGRRALLDAAAAQAR